MSQTWKPDTCSCVIQQDFNYAVTPPTLTSQVILRSCPRHSTPSDVSTENTLKNRGLAELLAVVATLDLTNEVRWVIDASGNILITITRNLTTQQRTNLAARLLAISPKLILQ